MLKICNLDLLNTLSNVLSSKLSSPRYLVPKESIWRYLDLQFQNITVEEFLFESIQFPLLVTILRNTLFQFIFLMCNYLNFKFKDFKAAAEKEIFSRKRFSYHISQLDYLSMFVNHSINMIIVKQQFIPHFHLSINRPPHYFAMFFSNILICCFQLKGVEGCKILARNKRTRVIRKLCLNMAYNKNNMVGGKKS